MKERPFEKWKINRHYAESPDGKYKFWVSNGYMFFADEGIEQLLSLLSFWEKIRVWRELKKEMRIRVTELLDVPPIKGVE